MRATSGIRIRKKFIHPGHYSVKSAKNRIESISFNMNCLRKDSNNSKEILDSPSHLQDTLKTLADSSLCNTYNTFSDSIVKINNNDKKKKQKNYFCYNIFNPNVSSFVDNLSNDEDFRRTYTSIAFHKIKTCYKHQGEVLRYYCVDCEKAYCDRCFNCNTERESGHKNHRLIDYLDYHELKLTYLQKEIKNKKDDMDYYIKRCEKYIESYEAEKKIVLEQINNLKNNYISRINNYITQIKEMMTTMKNYKDNIINKENLIKNFLTDLSREKLNKFENIRDLKKKFFINKNQPYNIKDINNIIKIREFKIFFKTFHTYVIKLSRQTLDSPKELLIEIKLRDIDSEYENNATFKIQHRRDWKPESAVIYFSLPKNKNKFSRNLKGYFLLRKYSGETESFNLTLKENKSFLFLSNDIPWDKFYYDNDNISIKATFFDLYFA